jgi:hypothetical protein
MTLLYNAHVPFVGVFLLFVVLMAGMHWKRR